MAEIPFLDRFNGFADIYDAVRPSPPRRLGSLLGRYAGTRTPDVVVDLGSGTGLSTRWAAKWSAAVVGVEPNHDMRAAAVEHHTPGVEYVDGVSSATGLDADVADVVIAVQAMHWMEPRSTLDEVARILRPGGVFAVIDADWPPVSGLAQAEQAWLVVHRRIRVLEARLSAGAALIELRRSIDDDDPALVDDDPRDPHLNRAMSGGRSWSKRGHLQRMEASGWFSFTRELVMDEASAGAAGRFVQLTRSQGSYQTLIKAGLTDDEIGVSQFEHSVNEAYTVTDAPTTLSFSWRVRLGCTPP